MFRTRSSLRPSRPIPRRLSVPLTAVIALVLVTLSPAPVHAATVPGAPTDVIGTKASATSAQVTFNPPANDGGATITSYEAHCFSTNGGSLGVVTGVGSPLTVGSLSAGFTYSCSVRATNSVGAGPFSTASPSFVLTTLPGAPTNVTATKVSATSAQVGYAPPASNGGATIISYTAQCTSTNGGAPGGVTSLLNPMTVNSLSAGFTYQCVVRATNSVGDGPFSTPSPPVVLTTLPGAPTNVIGTKASATSAQVTFNPPASNGGATITSYTAQCTSTNGGSPGGVGGLGSPLLVGSLSAGFTYQCVVRANNSVGAGPFSAPSPTFVLTTVPGPPTNVNATKASATSAQVTFNPPSDGGATITSYTAQCTSTNGGSLGVVTGVGSPLTVGSLSAGFTYQCAVRATNSVGDGPFSSSSPPFVLTTVPGAPVDVAAVGSSPTSAQVTFSPPASDGGTPITGYEAECLSSDGGIGLAVAGETSPIVVEGLTPGATYQCTVRAQNSIGQGDLSAPSSPFTLATTVPGVPTDVSATSASSTSATVSFSAPLSDGGSAVTSYVARCESTNGGVTRSQTGASSPITVLNLSGGRDYRCQVRAINGIGSSPFSDLGDTFTLPPVRPDAPTGVSATAASSTSATVSFTPPAWHGGSAITSYVARCVSTNGGITRTKSGSGSPITVTNLTKGKGYRCQVAAVNSVGVSAYSPLTSAFTLPPGVPDAPRNVRAIPLTSTTARVSFAAPLWNGGSAITSYLARCVSSNGGTTRAKTGAASPLTVGSLTPGKTYRCQVRATNSVGNSPFSAFTTSFKLPT